jgi:rhamnulokinase
MTRAEVNLAAVDLGASSGRVILGRVGQTSNGSGVLDLKEVHRFRNGPVRLPDGLYWDILGLYQDILIGLTGAVRQPDDLAGLAIDSWAVDYGLLDQRGALVGNPRHYRDSRTDAVIDLVHRRVDPVELYAINGLQFLPFNTVYQFAAEVDLDRAQRTALLIPDLLGYWLTGVQATEETNASTTGLLDARTGRWSSHLFEALGLPTGLLPEIVPAGSTLGRLSSDVQAEIGAPREVTVSLVGSHDTASAVAGVPAQTPRFGYISCGTWGLVGVELEAPVFSDQSRDANFTNERGVDGTIRYLRNVMGLWLLSECLRTWKLRGLEVDLPDVLARAAELPATGPRFDPNDAVFLPPGDMPERIVRACRAAGEKVPQTIPDVVRSIVDSLAVAFAKGIDQAEELSGHPVEVVHVVGGGSRNDLLCQLIADAAERPVIAGPVEATALGNLLVQARTHGVISGDLWTLRARIRSGLRLTTYQPRTTVDGRDGGGSRTGRLA